MHLMLLEAVWVKRVRAVLSAADFRHPVYREIGNEHFAACHRADELALQPIRSA
mgnify:CR=1 FL=1